MRRNPSRRWRPLLLGLVGVALVGGLLTAGAVVTDTLGARHLYERAMAKVDRYLAGPVPDRSTAPTVQVTDPPETPAPTDTPVPTSTPPRGTASSAPATPAPTPKPTPARKPVDVSVVAHPAQIFAHERDETWCAAAGVQIVLAHLGLGDTSNRFQAELEGRVHEWESYADSHNGKWGPSAMALALDAYGAPGYQVRAYTSRLGALRDAAKALEKTRSPVLLLAWRGAHTWVMSGFRADSDPRLFPYAKISGAYILDPWYPDTSSIWGVSDPPGAFQDEAEMERNYLRWDRPEGAYKDRDGLFIAVVPTVVVKPVD